MRISAGLAVTADGFKPISNRFDGNCITSAGWMRVVNQTAMLIISRVRCIYSTRYSVPTACCTDGLRNFGSHVAGLGAKRSNEAHREVLCVTRTCVLCTTSKQ